MFKKKSVKELVSGAQEETPRPKTQTRKSPGFLRSRVFLGCICIAAALFLAFGLTPAANLLTSQETAAVRVSQDVAKGTLLTEEMLEPTRVVSKGLGGDLIAQPSAAAGRYAAVDLVRGDLLSARKVTDALQYDDPYLSTLPDGKLAISVAMQSAAESLSGKLRAGDIIRLYSIQNNIVSETQSTAESLPGLQYVEVLSVTNGNLRDLDAKNEGLADAETADKAVSTVTLAVNEQQAAVLAGLNQKAVLHAALVTRGDEQAKRAALERQEAYFKPSAAAPDADGETAETPQNTGASGPPSDPGPSTPAPAATEN